MSDDDEWYRILREMNEKDRQAWNEMQQRHLEETQGMKDAAAREVLLKRQDIEREAFKEPYRQELHQQQEVREQALAREQNEAESRFFTEESLRQEGAQHEAEITSKFFDAKEQQRLADEAQKAALDEQALQQEEAVKAQIAAQELGVADAVREQEAIQKRNAEIIEKERQIQEQLEAGTLKPPTQEQAEKAIQEQFDRRRDELAEFIKEQKQQEIEKTIGGIDDPEMQDYLKNEAIRIEQEWAQREVERLAAIAREEQARLDRERDFYSRGV